MRHSVRFLAAAAIALMVLAPVLQPAACADAHRSDRSVPAQVPERPPPCHADTPGGSVVCSWHAGARTGQ